MFKLRLKEQGGAIKKNHPGKKAVSRILKQSLLELGRGWVQSEAQNRTQHYDEVSERTTKRQKPWHIWLEHGGKFGFCPF